MANKKDDADPLNYVNIDSRLQKFETPDQFADFFCECAETQKKINKSLVTVVKEMAKTDKEFKEDIKTLIKEIVKEDKNYFWVRAFDKVKYVISVLFGVAITLLTTWLSNKIGN